VRLARKIIIGTSGLLGVVYLLTTLQYRVGSPSHPGAGFYPLVVAGLLLLSSIGAYLEIIRTNGLQSESAFPRGKHPWRPLSIFLAIAVYIIALPYTGCIFGSMIVTFVALQSVGGIRWYSKIIVTIGIAVGSYLLFGTLLGVSLPMGILLGYLLG